MKIAILGATGRTGRELIRTAAGRGHDLLAVVRSPGRLGTGNSVDVAVADARSAQELTQAIDGADAVVSCLGPVPGEDPLVLDAAAQACIAAMDLADIRRLVVVSASGPFAGGDGPVTHYVVKPILQRLLAASFEGLRLMEGHIRDSHLDWTIVRPPRLTSGRGRGHYRLSTDGNVRRGYLLARSDLALALADAVENPATIRRIVSVAN